MGQNIAENSIQLPETISNTSSKMESHQHEGLAKLPVTKEVLVNNLNAITHVNDIMGKLGGLSMEDNAGIQVVVKKGKGSVPKTGSDRRPDLTKRHSTISLPLSRTRRLSATSAEFVPRNPAETPRKQARAESSQLLPSSSTLQTSSALEKIKRLIKDMPPPIVSRRPFPSGHQGGQGLEAYQSYQNQGDYQTPNYQSAGYQTPSYHSPGYQSHGYQGLDYRSQLDQVQGYQNASYQAQDYQVASYRSPINPTQSYQTESYSSSAYQVPVYLPLGSEAQCYQSESYQSPGGQQSVRQDFGHHMSTSKYHSQIHSPQYQSPISQTQTHQNFGYQSPPSQNPDFTSASISTSVYQYDMASTYPISGSLPSFQTPIRQEASFSLPTPLPTGYGDPPNSPEPRHQSRSFLAREIPTASDVIITNSKIVRNIVRIFEHCDEHGETQQVHGDEFKEGNYDVVEHLRQMDVETRKDFWECNWVEVQIDFRQEQALEAGSSQTGNDTATAATDVVEMMSLLGSDFPKYARTVFVVILLPPSSSNSDKILSLTSSQEQSSQYKLIEDLVLKLDEFKSIRKMEVILRTPSMTARSPLSLEHINYFLPFYDLEFEEWETKWQAPYMSRAETIHAWPLTYLDRERHKINMHRYHEKRLKEEVGSRRFAIADSSSKVDGGGHNGQRQRSN